MAEWYYAKDGQQQGPVDTPVLKQMAASGALLPTDMIWQAGMAEWAAASKAKGLFGQAAAPAAGAVATEPTYQCATCSGTFGRDFVYSENGVVICKQCHANRTAGFTQNYQQPGALQGGYAQPAYPQPGQSGVIGYASPGAVSTQHQLTEFSVAGVVLLHIVTCGLFSFFYFNLMHGKLPKNRHDDPSGGKALGFCFIPFFNIYWIFFSYLRLADRITEQRTLRGLPPVNKGIILAATICGLIPYLGVISALVLGPIAWGMLQGSVNELVQHSNAQSTMAYR